MFCGCAVDWPVVCDCGISWYYSLTFSSYLVLMILTLVLQNLDIASLENIVDPDQLASDETI